MRVLDLHSQVAKDLDALEKKHYKQVMGKILGLMKNPTPNVIFKNFGDNSLDFQLIFTYNNGFRVNLIESDIRFLVYKKFKENNINIPFPQRVVHLQK